MEVETGANSRGFMKEPKIKNLKPNKEKTSLIHKLAKSKKIKITINFDSDLIEIVKNKAQLSGIPYQTLINKTLREAINGRPTESTEERLAKIEREIKLIKKQIA